MAIYSTRSVLVQVNGPIERVVSLVPSMTQSMLDLGLAQRLVGITDYCPTTAACREDLLRCGGPKDPQVEAILQLQPDLIFANQEENSREPLQTLSQAGVDIWMSFPISVETALEELWVFARLFQLGTQGQQIIDQLSIAWEWAQRATAHRTPLRFCCPIWQQEDADLGLWWMTFNQNTYASDILAQCGGVNIFADRERRFPLEADLGLAPPEHPAQADTRYPRVTAQEITALDPEIILLPSEPYPFSAKDLPRLKAIFRETTAVRTGRVVPIDGRLITWHGTTMAKALAELPALFSLSTE